MNSSLCLKQLIGQQKTLIITCCDANLDILYEGGEQIFICTALGLDCQNHSQDHHIEYFVEHMECSQIIIAGHTPCRAMEHMLLKPALEPLVLPLQFHLQQTIEINPWKLLPKTIHRQMAAELNVIRQCKLLMENKFIQERWKQGRLDIWGCILINEHKGKKLFYNGIAFNDLILSN